MEANEASRGKTKLTASKGLDAIPRSLPPSWKEQVKTNNRREFPPLTVCQGTCKSSPWIYAFDLHSYSYKSGILKTSVGHAHVRGPSGLSQIGYWFHCTYQIPKVGTPEGRGPKPPTFSACTHSMDDFIHSDCSSFTGKPVTSKFIPLALTLFLNFRYT